LFVSFLIVEKVFTVANLDALNTKSSSAQERLRHVTLDCIHTESAWWKFLESLWNHLKILEIMQIHMNFLQDKTVMPTGFDTLAILHCFGDCMDTYICTYFVFYCVSIRMQCQIAYFEHAENVCHCIVF
jgi:hypothetical protein